MRKEFLERTGKAVLEERYQIFQEMQAAVKDAEAQGRAPNEREKAAWHRAANRYEELSLELAQVQQIERARDPESRAPLNYGVIGDLMKAAYNFGTERFTPDMRRSFDVTSGSAIVQDPRIQSEFFETFKANNPLADLGARFITGENYSQFPVQTADPSVVWFEEGDSAITPDSAATIGSVKIEYKVPAMLLLASNFWLEDTSRLGSEIIGRMAVSTLQEAVIKAVLNGTSAAKQPTGLDSVVGVQSVDGANRPGSAKASRCKRTMAEHWRNYPAGSLGAVEFACRPKRPAPDVACGYSRLTYVCKQRSAHRLCSRGE